MGAPLSSYAGYADLVIGDKREVVVVLAITDLVDPENEEVLKAVGIELFSDDSFTDRSYRAPGDSEQFCHAWSESFGTAILAHAQATRCSKSLVNRDSPTGRAKGTALD